jgi:hypothetical protein
VIVLPSDRAAAGSATLDKAVRRDSTVREDAPALAAVAVDSTVAAVGSTEVVVAEVVVAEVVVAEEAVAEEAAVVRTQDGGLT